MDRRAWGGDRGAGQIVRPSSGDGKGIHEKVFDLGKESCSAPSQLPVEVFRIWIVAT